MSFVAQTLSHLMVAMNTVDQLNLALAFGGFLVGKHPDVGRNAGVVEHAFGQGDDGLQKIVLENVATDLAFTTARATRKQGRAVEDDADAAAALLAVVRVVVTHFAQKVHEKQQ